VTADVGLGFTHDSGAAGDLHMPEIVGAGLALLDYDLDGDLDCYVVNGNAMLPAMGRAADPVNRLFRQEADGTFTDVTAAAGAGDGGYGMGCAVGDIDNDGDPDLYVTNFGPDRLLRNRGDGTFEDITESAGVDVPGWSCSAAFLDYDQDGYLDLYVTQYVEYLPEKRCSDDAGRLDYCGPKAFPPSSDVLLRHVGDADRPAYADASEAAGISTQSAAGLGVVIDDFDRDGWIDVYVANDGYANHLWRNRADGTFRDVALQYGVAYNLHGQAEAGMGVVSEDFTGDGTPDLFVTHLRQESNTMYRGGGVGFTDATGGSGLASSSMEYTGFGIAAVDLELDGDLDLYIGNGRVMRGPANADAGLPSPWDELAEPNLLYVNDGEGRFTAAGPEADTLLAPVEVTRGVAAGDLDGDGDLDLVVANTQGPLRVYRNDVPRAGTWLLVRVLEAGRDALGARVFVTCGERRQRRIVSPAVGYLTAHDVRVHFGLGARAAYDSIEVHWPDGGRERFPGGPAERSITLARGQGETLE
jgi:hypothetical protein